MLPRLILVGGMATGLGIPSTGYKLILGGGGDLGLLGVRTFGHPLIEITYFWGSRRDLGLGIPTTGYKLFLGGVWGLGTSEKLI